MGDSLWAVSLMGTSQVSTVLSRLRLRLMSQDIRDLVTPSCDLLAFGEPTHLDPAFGHARNELFAQLVEERGFRSIALETDRIPAFVLDDHVRDGTGDFDEAILEMQAAAMAARVTCARSGR